MDTSVNPGKVRPDDTNGTSRHATESVGVRLKRTLMPVLALLLGLTLAFMAGYVVASARLGQERAQLSAARATNHLLTSQGALYAAAIDLEQRNFGSANGHVQTAKQALGAIDATAGRVDSGRLAALKQSVSAVDVRITSDLQSQRTQILDLAQQSGLLARNESASGTR